MGRILALAVFFAATTAFAEVKEGFIFRGKEHVVYKDGVKVGPTFAEAYPSEAHKKQRAPASLFAETRDIYFFEDHNIKCYRIDGWAGISCAHE